MIPVNIDDVLILGGIHAYNEMRLMHTSGEDRYDCPDIDEASYIIIVRRGGTGTDDRVFDALYKHGSSRYLSADKSVAIPPLSA